MNKADENAEVVRRGYQAYNTGNVKTLTEIFDPTASWHTPGRSPIAGEHQGRDAVFAQFGRYAGDTGGTFKAALKDVLKSDDGRVIGIHHNSAQRNGKRLDTGCCIVFEVRATRRRPSSVSPSPTRSAARGWRSGCWQRWSTPLAPRGCAGWSARC
jgi:ketosteroid isomerase-like protein